MQPDLTPLGDRGRSRLPVVLGVVLLLLVALVGGGLTAYLTGRSTTSAAGPPVVVVTTVVVTGTVVKDSSGSAQGPTVAASLQAYVNAINAQQPAAAYAVLSPHAQSLTSFTSFSAGEKTTTITSFEVLSVMPSADGHALVGTHWRSTQEASAGTAGQTCSDWQMTYDLTRGGAGWQIDVATAAPGSPAAC